MPRGAKPGERRGGRAIGVLNRGTIEKAIKAERVIANAKASGGKLAVEHMQDFIGVLAGMAAYYQPTFPGMKQSNPFGNDKEFERWFRCFLDLAKTLAPFESPTMRSIQMEVGTPGTFELMSDDEIIREITIESQTIIKTIRARTN